MAVNNITDGVRGLTGVFDKDVLVPVDSNKLNSSFKKFNTRFDGLTPEQQCFAKVWIQAPVKAGSDTKIVVRRLELLTWVSLGMPVSTINFKAAPETLYTNIFGGISSPEFINVGYQDFNDLHITSALWDFYTSQFTAEGYRIKRALAANERPYISYLFYDFYDDPLKSYSSKEPLWEVNFEDVVFKEPQLSGLAPTVGNLSRSFQFSFERYNIVVPEATYRDKAAFTSFGKLNSI